MSDQMNRRTMLKQTAAALTGSAVAVAAPAVRPAPDHLKTPSDAVSELERWEEDRYGKPGGAKRRRLDEALAALLSVYREAEAAMSAVLDAHYEVKEDSYWLEDVDAVRFWLGMFIVMLDVEVGGNAEAVAAAELERCLEASKRGAFHHCPAFWGNDVLKRAKEAAWAVADRDYEPGERPCIAQDVRYQAWLLEFLEGTYHNEAHCYMNDAASDAWARS